MVFTVLTYYSYNKEVCIDCYSSKGPSCIVRPYLCARCHVGEWWSDHMRVIWVSCDRGCDCVILWVAEEFESCQLRPAHLEVREGLQLPPPGWASNKIVHVQHEAERLTLYSHVVGSGSLQWRVQVANMAMSLTAGSVQRSLESKFPGNQPGSIPITPTPQFAERIAVRHKYRLLHWSRTSAVLGRPGGCCL